MKSCRGFPIERTPFSPAGFRFDREWMVVNEEGVFVAQRAGSRSRGIGAPALVHVRTAIAGDELLITAPDMDPLRIDLNSRGPERRARVWSRIIAAKDEGEDAARWFSEFLSRGRPGAYRLVRILAAGTDLPFVDDAPFHVTSWASLADLNRRLEKPVSMDRFRPTIVLEGIDPYEENSIDQWTTMGHEFVRAAPCTRCPITMIDQASGQQGREPLTTLAKYRRTASGVVFGHYFTTTHRGELRKGASVEIRRSLDKLRMLSPGG